MRSHFQLCLISLLLLLAQRPCLQAQVSAQLQVLPPYSPFLSDYTSKANAMVVLLSNTDNKPHGVYFTGSVTGDNGVSAQTKQGYKPANAIQIAPNSSVQISGAQLSPFFNWDMGTLQGVNTQQIERSGMLPEGSYEICIDVRDFATGNLMGTVQPSACSQHFNISSPNPPIITSPSCGSTVRTGHQAFIQFSWAPPSGVPLQRMQYRLKIVEVIPPTRNLQEAMNSATTPALLNVTTPNNTYLLNPALLMPASRLEGALFAFNVTVIDRQKEIVFVNNGESEVCSFNTEAQPPDTTVDNGGCSCDASCSIKAGLPVSVMSSSGVAVAGTQYEADIHVRCKGAIGRGSTKVACTPVRPYTYKWHIGESGVDEAEIIGPDDGSSVNVVRKGRGPYNLYLNGTAKCNAGPPCEFHCGWEEKGLPPPGEPDICKRAMQADKLPKMDGGLLINEFFVKERKILRDDYLPLAAYGADYDRLLVSCTPIPKCPDKATTKQFALAGRVRFEWKIISGGGRFVKLGCLYTNGGDDQQDKGEHVIFMPPVVPLPPKGKDTSEVSTEMMLSIIDDKDDAARDDQVDRPFRVVTRRKKSEPDRYYTQIVYSAEVKMPKAPERFPGDTFCHAIFQKWTLDDNLKTPVINLPDVPDNSKMVLGEMIVLMADSQRDGDLLTGIECKSEKNCHTELPGEFANEDNIEWEWSKGAGPGQFVGSNIGRYVIYQAPKRMPDGQTETQVSFTVKVRNPEAIQCKDKDPKASDPVSISIYKPGIQQQYPAPDWVPEPGNSVEPRSELKYLSANNWLPALAHMCRIHFFELKDVSTEKGLCLNDPLPAKADQCRDLQLKDEGDHEAFDAGTEEPEKCTLKDQWMKARTKKPELSYAPKVYSNDYGSYGFLSSSAKIQTWFGDDPAGEYESIPWTDETVKHLHPVRRSKAKTYVDNRVNIPYDIDENQMPDSGWRVLEDVWIQDFIDRAIADIDTIPMADGFAGDGLTSYEEYRGFIIPPIPAVVMSGSPAPAKKPVPAHIRTHPFIKDLFIHNRDNLKIDLYDSITGLQVIEISAAQYISDEKKVVNFNFNKATHVVDQEGLFLVNEKLDGRLLGKAYSKVGDHPARPNDSRKVAVDMEQVEKWLKGKNDELKHARDKGKKNPDGSALKDIDPLAKKRQVIAHELCHASNICHHGEGDETVEYDNKKENPLRKGVINCVMRYDNLRKEGSGWLIGYSPEIPGAILCNSPVGTGYNDPAITPTGNAEPGRGNCIGQLRISGVGKSPPPCPKPK